MQFRLTRLYYVHFVCLGEAQPGICWALRQRYLLIWTGKRFRFHQRVPHFRCLHTEGVFPGVYLNSWFIWDLPTCEMDVSIPRRELDALPYGPELWRSGQKHFQIWLHSTWGQIIAMVY